MTGKWSIQDIKKLLQRRNWVSVQCSFVLPILKLS